VITIYSPTKSVSVRTDRPTFTKSLQRTQALGNDGSIIVAGDLKWNPATAEISASVSGPSPALAMAALQELLDTARAARALHTTGSSLIYVHGVQRIRRSPKRTNWRVTITFLLKGPLVGAQVSNSYVTYAGQTVTSGAGSEPVTWPA
jgi:hypothetical protein